MILLPLSLPRKMSLDLLPPSGGNIEVYYASRCWNKHKKPKPLYPVIPIYLKLVMWKKSVQNYVLTWGRTTSPPNIPNGKKRLDESIAKITTSALKMHVFFFHTTTWNQYAKKKFKTNKKTIKNILHLLLLTQNLKYLTVPKQQMVKFTHFPNIRTNVYINLKCVSGGYASTLSKNCEKRKKNNKCSYFCYISLFSTWLTI